MSIVYLSSQTIDSKLDKRDRQDYILRNNPDNNSINYSNEYRDEDELLEFVESIMENYLIPGLSISIVKGQNIVWEKYLGYSNVNQNILVNENTIFMLASVSKTITATALMQLFENGFFSLDDNINNYSFILIIIH